MKHAPTVCPVRPHTCCGQLLAVMLPLIWASSVVLAEPPLLDEFRESVKRWTAGAGSVIFSLEFPEKSKLVDRRTFGFDPATGAWFSATKSSVSGRTAEGVSYSGTPDKVTPIETQPPPLPGPLAGRIPMALPLQLLQTTDRLVDVSKNADSDWVVEYLGFAPEGVEQPHARMMFSPEGTPLRFEMDARPQAGIDAIAHDFEFEPDSKSPLLVTVERSSPARETPRSLVEIEYYPMSRPDLFTTEVVLAIAVDNRMVTQMRRNARAAGLPGPAPSAGGTNEVPYVDHRLSRAGWPLIVTGIVVVGLGVFVLIRSRSGK